MQVISEMTFLRVGWRNRESKQWRRTWHRWV